MSIAICLSSAPRTTRPGRPASSRSSASPRLPSVADRPQTRSSGFHARRRASPSSVMTPRLLPRSSCHSSTTTRRSCESFSRAPAFESISDRLSGVVTSADGSRFAWRARSALVVSPVRSPTVQPVPRPSAARCSDRTVSAASARIGVIQRTRRGGAVDSDARSGRSCNPSASGPSHAASVLPLPVAEWTSPDSPAR